jgi:hypothetical protein
MTRFGKLIAGAALMAGTVLGTTALTTTAADAGVHIGIGVGVPGVGFGYGPGYGGDCYSARFRYYHPGYCGGYGYGPAYNGYYDTGFYGPGYYEPINGGFWFTDGFGHRRWHGGAFHGGGFHGGHWHH